MADKKSTHGTWKPQTEFVTLPSGQCPRIRRIDVISFIMDDGNVPDSIVGFLNKGGDLQKLSGEDTAVFVRLLGDTCRKVFVSPRIVAEPDYDNNEIHVSDVEFADKLFLFQHLMGGAAQASAARFPAEQSADGGTPPQSKILREVTE